MDQSPRQTPENPRASLGDRANFDFLRGQGWSANTPIEQMDGPDNQRILELIQKPKSPAEYNANVVGLAYYALELGTQIMPIKDLRRTPSGEDEQTARQYQIARAVAREIIAAGNAYSAPRSHRSPENNHKLWAIQQSVNELTKDFTPHNTACFAALAIMSRENVSRPYAPTTLSHDATYVLRMFVAKEQGLTQDYNF